jgi:hypothetical protein
VTLEPMESAIAESVDLKYASQAVVRPVLGSRGAASNRAARNRPSPSSAARSISAHWRPNS